jgi:sugar phosphate isomerase/epimerase
VRRVTGLPGVFHADASRDRDLELAAEEAVRRVNECARAGVRYAIEPHLDSIGENVDGTRAFLDASEWLTLTLDYGHFITSGETSEQVHTLLRFASHVHARGGAFGRLQTSVDENTIDFPGMLAGLRELGYSGFLGTGICVGGLEGLQSHRQCLGNPAAAARTGVSRCQNSDGKDGPCLK